MGVAVMLSCGVVSSQAPPLLALTRTVYISVTDRNGVPVDTLTPPISRSRKAASWSPSNLPAGRASPCRST